GSGKNRLGGSILAQVFSRFGNVCPDLDSASQLKFFFSAIQNLNAQNLILAYHDRSDGGLFAAVCEMAFAGHCGVTVNLDGLVFDRWTDDVDGFKRANEEQLAGRIRERALHAMFAEELGAVLQIRTADRSRVMDLLRSFDLGNLSFVVGHMNPRDEVVFMRNAKPILKEKRVDLQRAWSETSFRMQQLRDNPDCAQEEYDRILDLADPGLSFQLTFDVKEIFIKKDVKPRIAVLREQGVNSQVEMAAAFTRAGFEAVDVHMSDVIAGRIALEGFKGMAICGGFSYGDVLGGGQGWAKSILFNARARRGVEAFFGRSDTFALGSCNGCQMMAALKEIIPGAQHWPVFVGNRSAQFEARFVMVEVLDSPSILLRGMAGSRMPITTAHGEGFALFENSIDLEKANVALRFVDHHGKITEKHPLNPNGSPAGITGLTTPDGRFTIVMPHPERVFRTVQMSWAPDHAKEDSPWMQMFYNARKWVG
ncbi:MAG: phosphoribosylformylglycinamidine synthase subunit PurQ, partial [Pseudomonadota bacterium]